METLIVAIGNELLNGKTQDMNSYWITKRLANLGYKIVRIVIVPDSKSEIIDALKWGYSKGIKLFILTGGLGPTPGDITLETVSEFLGKDIILDEEAVKYVKKRYEELYKLGFVSHPELNESRLKMAKVPRGSQIIYNDVGVAPGVILKDGDKTILCLPGVPSEMMYLLEKAIPHLPPASKERIYSREIRIQFGDESQLSKIFEKLMEKHKKLSIKSYPEGFGKNVYMRIIMEVKSGKEEEAEKLIKEVIKELEENIKTIKK